MKVRRDNRMLFITEIPEESPDGTGCLPELKVDVNCGDSNVFKALTLDHAIIPAMILGLTGIKVEYVCTYIAKTVEEDVYDEGCLPETHITTSSETILITGNTFAELLTKIGEEYDLDIQAISLPPCEVEDGNIDLFEFQRSENADGSCPTPAQINKWKEGNHQLWAATYLFRTQKRMILPISLDEIKAVVKVDE